jgi:hypothetical protein
MTPELKAPGNMLLKLRHDGPLSNFAFKFNLRCYDEGAPVTRLLHLSKRYAVSCAHESDAAHVWALDAQVCDDALADESSAVGCGRPPTKNQALLPCLGKLRVMPGEAVSAMCAFGGGGGGAAGGACPSPGGGGDTCDRVVRADQECSPQHPQQDHNPLSCRIVSWIIIPLLNWCNPPPTGSMLLLTGLITDPTAWLSRRARTWRCTDRPPSPAPQGGRGERGGRGGGVPLHLAARSRPPGLGRGSGHRRRAAQQRRGRGGALTIDPCSS